MDFTPEQLRLLNIFQPHLMQKIEAARQTNLRFVHYTKAESAMKILQNKEVWLRRSSCLNDFTEVKHGLRCLSVSFDDCEFRLAMDRIFPNASLEIAKIYNDSRPLLENETYLLCVSEHDDREDKIGRLSMWRAYGGTTGVAFVMNNKPFISPSDALNAYTVPVAYMNDDEVRTRLDEIGDNIKNNADFIENIGKETLMSWALHTLKFAALSIKHPGFKEEREWRVVYTPAIKESKHVEKALESVQGVPQTVYKIPLKNIPEEDFLGADIAELVDRIIIGPTQYPAAMQEAFIQLLKARNVPNPEAKVFISDIPLR